MKFKVLAVTCMLLPLVVHNLFAQSADTGILGAIADSSGAVIVDASVTITEPATGIVHNVRSSTVGSYEVRYLLPGQYVVEVRQPGFRSGRSSTITLRIGQMARVDFALQVGETNERVEVSAQGVLLETQEGTVGDVVSGERIANLPLSGRNFVQLGDLTPGVIASTSNTTGTFRANGARLYYQQASFVGSPGTELEFAL